MSELYYIKYSKELGTKHGDLLQAIRNRVDLSMDEMATRRAEWDKIDERVIGYLPETEIDAQRRIIREQDGKPQFTTIQIPWSYAVLMAAHTYLTSVFLARSPIFQFTARHGEPEGSVMAVEALIDYQVTRGELLVPLQLWLYDAYKYGMGVLGTYWADELETVATIQLQQPEMFGVAMGEPKKVKITQTVPSYQGNRGFNIRPHDFLPDPRVPIGSYQRGEFCGRLTEVGWNELLKGQAEGRYYNLEPLKYLQMVSKLRQREEGTSQMELPDFDPIAKLDHGKDGDDLGYVSLVEMCWELIPREWGLGKGDRPEKWMFTVANDEVIIGARPLGEWHNKYPYHVMEPELTGYQMVSRSPLEAISPLEDTLTWLFNSHFHNVRKVLNDQFIYDPSRVEEEDILDPDAGLMIRLKPAAYGTDPRTAVSQLGVVDVTQQHMQDARVIVELMQRLQGVNDAMMGLAHQSGRKTATEVRSATTFGVNRMKTIAEFVSAQGFEPMSRMLVQRTQQYYDDTKKFRIAGDLMQYAGQTFLQVSPGDILGFYDFVPVDGTLPVDRYAQAALWKDLIGQVAQVPQVLMQYDLGRIFGYVARLAGIRNIDQFRVQVQPDAALQQQMAMGNVVPMGGQGGQAGPVGEGASGEQRAAAAVPGSVAVGGVGKLG